MAETQKKSLRSGHKKAMGQEKAPETVRSVQVSEFAPDFIQARAQALSSIPSSIVKKSWFTMAHLLLDPGARVIDMGCQDGMMAYTMATLRPDLMITGIDKNPALIQTAKKSWQADNLNFITGDFNKNIIEKGSVDAIINSFLLHEIYSAGSYNRRTVYSTLDNQIEYLKEGGYLLVRDYAMPDETEFVLMEFPLKPATPEMQGKMSEAEWLIWFSDNARPRVDEVSPGFYLEELSPRFPNTRLFRLPYKWAYEFMMRNHDHAHWDSELPKQYTFFTEKDFVSTLSNLGMRIIYAAAQWNDSYIQKYFQGHFNLYDENYTPLSYPATSYLVLAQKISEKESQLITERRQAKTNPGLLHITAIRNEASGAITEIVSSEKDFAEIIPYRFSENNRVLVYLREGVLRGLVNTVRRTMSNIDDKFWSGHMVEALSIDIAELADIRPEDANAVGKFAMQRFKLKPAYGRSFEAGPVLYPDPHTIGERIETLYLNVETDLIQIELNDNEHLHAYDAQNILNAIAVGLIPSARLEVQILTLLERLSIPLERWSESPLVLEETDGGNTLNVRDLIARMAQDDTRFKDIRGTIGKIRIVNSVFVQEGRNDMGAVTSLSAKNHEFALMDDSTMNVAVVIPLSRDFSGEVMAGVNVDYLPVPQRYQGNGLIVTAPSFVLPKDVKTIEDARRFIASKYEVKIENVGRMGESYFSYIGMMPKRIFPFAVTGVKRKVYKGFAHGATALAPMSELWKLHYYDCDLNNMIKKIAEVYAINHANIEYTMVNSPYNFQKQIAPTLSTPLIISGDTLNITASPRSFTASAPGAASLNTPSIGPEGSSTTTSGKKSSGGKAPRLVKTIKSGRKNVNLEGPKPTPDK